MARWPAGTRCPHQKIVEYLESLGDPLKCYFEEKAAALFLRPEVLQVFLAADNQAKDHLSPTPFLSDLNLAISEEEDGLQPAVPDRPRHFSLGLLDTQAPTEEELLKRYNSSKITRQIDCNYMMRVNDELRREGPTMVHDTLALRLQQLDRLEDAVCEALERQDDALLTRLARIKVTRAKTGEAGLSGSSPKSVLGSLSTLGSRMSRGSPRLNRRSHDLFGTAITITEPAGTPDDSELFRTGSFSGLPLRTDFHSVQVPGSPDTL